MYVSPTKFIGACAFNKKLIGIQAFSKEHPKFLMRVHDKTAINFQKEGELTPSFKENLSVENANQKGYSVWKYEK
jgi:hypothetical protein